MIYDVWETYGRWEWRIAKSVTREVSIVLLNQTPMNRSRKMVEVKPEDFV